MGCGRWCIISTGNNCSYKVIGAGLNKAFPNLFKDKAKEVEKILTDTHKKNYNVDDKGLEKLYNISELQILREHLQTLLIYKTIIKI